MDKAEFEAKLDRAFSKSIRIVAQNSKDNFSSTWLFKGNKNDFYFGSRTIMGELKISLHENGTGYVAFHKPYLLAKQAQGINVPDKTLLQWKLPTPEQSGAVHAASLFLPADYCRRSDPLSESEKKQTLILGIEDGCTVEVGLFLSREPQATLEDKLLPLGKPLFVVTLDNGLGVAFVARSRDFDPSVLPTDEQMKSSKSNILEADAISTNGDLNAMLWNKPGDGGTLQVIDVGGVRWKDDTPQIK